ncbi:protein-disulfide reductase DsbD [Massilia dura]|uniref:Thiol:disulfide interchange protein DsbD n=1 Tax=Pseudoduganella dura TaxID=321982 RepID=A0A6I3XTC7_9BURK|nr:protein-disulfide reductase DsbD [Pseudoduganella dura]MUI15758.1 protein-disulfide reductase DsbD [Pseudoduganella dura]GGX89148.1 thiol:disulfide interchange protein DsbD [Pseudoduganella dura]
MKHIIRWLAVLLLLAAGISRAAHAADDFLAPEQAFQVGAELRGDRTVRLAWAIAPGYHLYRERLVFGSPQTGQPALPDGLRKFDANFNKEMETHAGRLVADLPLKAGAKAPFLLKVGYQGCADEGLCYPPAEVAFQVDPSTPGALRPVALPAGAAPVAAASAAVGKVPDAPVPEDDSSLAQRTLRSGSAWRIGLAFLAFGLLLSFTPCVLPMVPILSSIIVGGGQVSRGKGFALALVYSLGMAAVYTALGVAAGLAGEGLAGALQKPWVLLLFGALLVALALSMFDVYQLQLPGSLQSRVSETSGRMSGGRAAGVFGMGALSALIVGPCVAAPLAGALLYISQTRDVWTGGWALFSMAAGMSVPLLVTGISAGSLLPRAGAWMDQVKRVFGLLLIAVAIWMVMPVFPVPVAMLLWGAFAVLCAVFLRVFEPVASGAGLRGYAGRTLGVVLLACGLFELFGAASGGRDVLQPLAHLRGGPVSATASTAHEGGEVRFQRIRNVAELEQTLAAHDGPVMLDFYADWCVSCKEMERFTFSRPEVAARMKGVRLLQADVTANNEHDRALMKKFGLFGPPGIILFRQGREVPDSRVIGFMGAEQFARHLARSFES